MVTQANYSARPAAKGATRWQGKKLGRRSGVNLESQIKKAIDLTEVAISRIANTERLRSQIDAPDQKISASGSPVTSYEKWCRWAIPQANEIAPRYPYSIFSNESDIVICTSKHSR